MGRTITSLPPAANHFGMVNHMRNSADESDRVAMVENEIRPEPALVIPLRLAAAAVSLIFLAWLSTWDSATIHTDHPYEEARDLYVLQDPSVTVGVASPWTENPPLDLLVRHGVARLTGSTARSVLRLPSLVYLVISFLLTTWLVDGRPDPRRGPSLTAVVIALALHSMPALLIGARRISPALLSCIGVELVIASSWSLLQRPRVISTAATAASHAILIWSHPYGWLLSMALAVCTVVTALLQAFCTTKPTGEPVRKLLARLAAAFAALSIPLFHFDWWRSYHAVFARSYWAETVNQSSISEAFHNPVLVGLTPIFKSVPEMLPATFVVLFAVSLLGLARYRDAPSPYFGLAILATAFASVATEWRGGPFVMIHASAPILYTELLCTSVIVCRFGSSGRLLASFFLTAVVTLPVVERTLSDPVRDDGKIVEACRALTRLAGPDAPVLIGGSRLYFLLYDALEPLAPGRVFVDLRDRYSPDNFPGRYLLPDSMVLTEAHWKHIRATEPRVVYVQMDGSQTINIEIPSWEIAEIDSYPLIARSVGTIDLIDLVRDSSGTHSEPRRAAEPR